MYQAYGRNNLIRIGAYDGKKLSNYDDILYSKQN